MMLITTLLLAASLLSPGEGQGQGAPDARVDEFQFGEYWYGADIGHDELIGKVVLVELWGS